MIGSVRQPPRASPSMSAKSFVVDAPRRKRPKIIPMYQGSTPTMVLTHDQPATLSSTPLGIAIVTLAQMPRCFVRSGGQEYTKVATVAATTIQKHSCRPPGVTSHASPSASAYVVHVKIQASRIVRRPLVRGRVGLLIRSISRS